MTNKNEPLKGLGAKRPKPIPVRYRMMAALMDREPMAAEEFARVLARHRQFIASGGGGGRWYTLVTPDTEKGVVLGLYLGPAKERIAGEQASLEHKRLEGLNLRGVQLPYANLCGVSCRGQDLCGANLAGSLATDADFAGSNFQEANLAGVDFSRSDLSHCDFRQADLTRCDFENADLTGADLRGARTEGARFLGALMAEVRE